MRKIALIAALCLLLVAVPVAYARTFPAYGPLGQSVMRPAAQAQTVRIGGTFTRQVAGVRYVFTLMKIDTTARKLTLDQRAKGKKITLVVPYDTNNMALLMVREKQFSLTVDTKRGAIRIGYGY